MCRRSITGKGARSVSRKEEQGKIPVFNLIRQFAGYEWRCSPSFFIFYFLDPINLHKKLIPNQGIDHKKNIGPNGES